ncbi:CAP domain-containing protein [Desarmillaria tabescens]|uniref:CAP domain-containing protein n=1 Tax=Armillaria tabescens TaxID=1929756 RepID=A0AA39JM63_ARMTA|nr:CAP domain-containing protein [Desarmillaria tabescens]KAK0445330.1 CAP domain-containing protein [Desarmillaria tabescens]
MSFARLSAFLFVCAATALTVAFPADSTIVARDDASWTNDATFRSAILDTTNSYRSAHGASALTWDDTLASYALQHTQPCVFQHSGGPYGENLAAGYASPSASVAAWGDEGKQYSCSNPGFSSATGHFTQLVWKSTTKVGCGRVNCNGSNGTPGWYLTCEYSPAGNIVGNNNQYFKDNVQC